MLCGDCRGQSSFPEDDRLPSTAVYVISWTQSLDLPWEWNTVDSYIPADAAVQEREDVPVPSWVYVLKPEHPFFGNSRKLGKGCEACFGKGKAMEVDPGGLLL